MPSRAPLPSTYRASNRQDYRRTVLRTRTNLVRKPLGAPAEPCSRIVAATSSGLHAAQVDKLVSIIPTRGVSSSRRKDSRVPRHVGLNAVPQVLRAKAKPATVR